jgi:hypothetical protein
VTTTIVFSGKKQSGKSTAAKYVWTRYVNEKLGEDRFAMVETWPGSEQYAIADTAKKKMFQIDVPTEETIQLAKAFGIRLYGFADEIKSICSRVFGIPLEILYGTDEQKARLSHGRWDDVCDDIKKKFCGPNGRLPVGNITYRDLMKIVGNEFFRSIDSNCWVMTAYNLIKSDGFDVALIADCRYPNEVTVGVENGAHVCRLGRAIDPGDTHSSEVALDGFPEGEYSKVFDNSEWSMEKKNKEVWAWASKLIKENKHKA